MGPASRVPQNLWGNCGERVYPAIAHPRRVGHARQGLSQRTRRTTARVSLSVCPNRACSVLVSRPGADAGCRAYRGTFPRLGTDRSGFLRAGCLCWSLASCCSQTLGRLNSIYRSCGQAARCGVSWLQLEGTSQFSRSQWLKVKITEHPWGTFHRSASRGRSVFRTTLPCPRPRDVVNGGRPDTVSESYSLAPALGPMPRSRDARPGTQGHAEHGKHEEGMPQRRRRDT
jgi:hypothetical protein